MSFDPERARADFPILRTTVHGKPLVFLDSAARAQKPECVIEAVSDAYRTCYDNVERGVYELSVRATEMVERAREKVAAFLGVGDPQEVIFVRNATEAINLVAYSFGRQNVGPGDAAPHCDLSHASRNGGQVAVGKVDDLAIQDESNA